MIASLPMYATPLTADADARLWHGIRDRLRDAAIPAPDGLTLGITDLMAHWLSPQLVLSQTCSLPYRAHLRDAVTLVGTPDYGLAGCPPGHYQSLIIARCDDSGEDWTAFQGARFAYNDPMSQSGWAAVALEAPTLLQGPRLHTGSHSASARAVRDGNADIAAIDAVTFRHLTQAGDTSGLRVVHATRPTPGLPLIAAADIDGQTVLTCVAAAIADMPSADRAMLDLQGIIAMPQSAYDLPIPPRP